MKVRKHFYLTEELIEEAYNQGIRESRSLNNMMEHAMKVYLELKRTQSPCGDCTKQDSACRVINCQYDKFNRK